MKREDCKKSYEAPEAEVICFENDDVIKTSTETNLPPVNGTSGPNLY